MGLMRSDLNNPPSGSPQFLGGETAPRLPKQAPAFDLMQVVKTGYGSQMIRDVKAEMGRWVYWFCAPDGYQYSLDEVNLKALQIPPQSPHSVGGSRPEIVVKSVPPPAPPASQGEGIDWVSAREFAAYMDVSVTTVYRKAEEYGGRKSRVKKNYSYQFPIVRRGEVMTLKEVA